MLDLLPCDTFLSLEKKIFASIGDEMRMTCKKLLETVRIIISTNQREYYKGRRKQSGDNFDHE